MPQIEIPFTIGQRVRAGDYEFEVKEIWLRGGRVMTGDGHGNLWAPGQLTLVEQPVIEWKRDDRWGQWRSDDWYAKDDGSLLFGAIGPHLIGTFDDPRAVAEATQKLWNEMRKHEENTNAI